ncbi:MAG: hypothetical protein AAFX06_33240 [Planctomycetota bacterium]
MSVNVYKRQSLQSGWTRVDLLLEIYDRAIAAIQNCEAAEKAGDDVLFGKQSVLAQKALLAIHSGLKPEEDEVAFNIARLLLFAADAVEAKNYGAAVKVLQDLRGGFAAVAEEANQLERDGVIPGFPNETGAVF